METQCWYAVIATFFTKKKNLFLGTILKENKTGNKKRWQ
jgi:hypothetical protein